MMCSLKVVSCLLLVMLASSVNGQKDCSAITCPLKATYEKACNGTIQTAIITSKLTGLCCTYCVRILQKGEACNTNTYVEPLVSMCMVECDPKTNKCVVPPGSRIKGTETEPEPKPNQGSSMFKVKVALLEMPLLVVSLASIFYVTR